MWLQLIQCVDSVFGLGEAEEAREDCGLTDIGEGGVTEIEGGFKESGGALVTSDPEGLLDVNKFLLDDDDLVDGKENISSSIAEHEADLGLATGVGETVLAWLMTNLCVLISCLLRDPVVLNDLEQALHTVSGNPMLS